MSKTRTFIIDWCGDDCCYCGEPSINSYGDYVCPNPDCIGWSVEGRTPVVKDQPYKLEVCV